MEYLISSLLYLVLALIAIFLVIKSMKGKVVSKKEIIKNNNIDIKKTPNYVTGSYIDNDGYYTVGDDVYEAETIRSFSSFDESNYTVSVIEQKCPKCNVWLTHHCYGKYQCSNCGFIDIYREDPLNN
jgi:predicted RNA-binding Zn-ribbon protein involved in translation (DUF1610 family)